MNIPPELAAFISSSPDDLLKQWSNYENSVIDYCSYYIYCDNINHILSSHVIDTYESVKSYIDDKIKDYLWHKHKFNLQIIVPSNDSSSSNGSSGNKSPIYFHGLVKYGDNIEDEWYIVYILIETSKKFPGLSIKVVDADGEFILIEAADYLPKWIGPENSENRVWIRNGLINIISPEDVGSSNHSGIKISQAITALQRSNTKLSTCADDRVQSCIRNRTVNVYPGKAKASEFTTICYLPTNVASLLQTHPDLITIAVESFCSSDKNVLIASIRVKLASNKFATLCKSAGIILSSIVSSLIDSIVFIDFAEIIILNCKDLIYETSELLKQDKLLKAEKISDLINTKYKHILDLKID
jgi:hypothetical protein